MIRDQHSSAEPTVSRVRHLSLALRADFGSKTLSGTATLDLENAAGANEVVLDTDGLMVTSVKDAAGAPLEFALAPRDPVKGSALRVTLQPTTSKIVVAYSTAPGAAALQWLAPEQTAGKRHPFLFTQGQAILTRTWIPIQDSPGIRLTYDATIEVPDGLIAVMSAQRKNPDGDARGAYRAFSFEMPYPIPAYLLALAVGQLEFRSLGPRSGVFAEPAVIEAAAYELAETEQMIVAAEDLYGPYRWGRYDVLVLPPSFPFGGMENPCVTFATPTILAGDRSLVSLIAHELAHSWSGNLVTNATWEDFWLNEGFTVYFEGRIMERIYGREYGDMLQVLGYQDLQADIAAFGATSTETRLVTVLKDRNPDDAFSSVPYEKGALFLRWVERAVGRKRFDAFLREYFDRHAFQSMTSQRFIALVRDVLFSGDVEAFAKLETESWLHSPGLRADALPPHSQRLAAAEAVAARFAAGAPAASLPTAEWSTHEWLHFLRKLPERVAPERLAELDRAFALLASGNSEKRFEFLRVAIRSDWRIADASLEQFLLQQGRRKFLKPLYTDLAAKEWGKPLAKAIYQKARPGYHSVSTNTIDQILAAIP
jgi:leukotriene-A4 hydrolase